MKYIGEEAITKLISLIKRDLATKQPTITASGLLKGDGAGTVTAADTQEATLVDVPNGLLKGDGTTISAAVAETDYMVPPTGGTTGQILKKTETGTEWADTSVFIATYGTTTSAEIEAAYQAGKAVICFYNNGVVYRLAMAISAGETYYFEGAVPTVEYDDNDKPSKVVWKKYYIECAYDVWQVATAPKNGTVPSTHASTHSSGGSDPITPASIGAATMEEVNTAIQSAIQNTWEASY